MRPMRTFFLGVFALSSAPRNVRALEAFDRAREEASEGFKDHMPRSASARADLLERAGYLHLALAERLQMVQTARQDDRSSANQARIGELALALDHYESVVPLALSLRRREISLPIAMRAALAAYYMKIGMLSQAEAFMPDSEQLRSLPHESSRFRALFVASGIQAANNHLERAISLLSPVQGYRDEWGSLAHLQRARFKYDLGRFTEALEELIFVPRNTSSWYPGMLVGAWAAYRVRDDNLALGQLLSLHSPQLIGRYNPESFVLEAISLYRLCHFESAMRSIEQLRRIYKGFPSAIDGFRRQLGDHFAGVTALLNTIRGFKSVRVDPESETQKRILDGILMEQPIHQADATMVLTEAEEKFLAKVKRSPAIELPYRREIEAAKHEAYRTAVKSIEERLLRMKMETLTSLENALPIEIEINTRIRERLIAGRVPRRRKIDFDAEIQRGYTFWPFQGEFWRDEVGSYVYATTDVCSAGPGT